MIAMRTRHKNTANAALLLLCVAQLMVLLDASIVQIALPSIQQEFGAASGRLQWITTAYTLCFGGFLLVGSRLGDRFGRRRTLAAGAWLFALASAAAGFAPAFGVLIAARALQGLSAALIAPMVFVFVAALFPEGPPRNRAMGILSSVSAVGFVTGLILGGTLTEWFGWRAVFFLTVLTGSRFGTRPVLLAGATAFALGSWRLSQLAAQDAYLAHILC